MAPRCVISRFLSLADATLEPRTSSTTSPSEQPEQPDHPEDPHATSLSLCLTAADSAADSRMGRCGGLCDDHQSNYKHSHTPPYRGAPCDSERPFCFCAGSHMIQTGERVVNMDPMLGPVTETKVIAAYRWLVPVTIRRMGLSRRTPNSEDIKAAGMVGLLKAVRFFDPSRNVPFGAYARMRIGMEIVDELRRLDPLDRRSRRLVSTAAAAETDLLSTGCTPSRAQVADQAGVSEPMLARLSVQWPGAPAPQRTVEELAISHIESAQVRAAVARLPSRLRSLITAHYFADVPMARFAEAERVSRSRVSQLHARALRRLERDLAVKRVR